MDCLAAIRPSPIRASLDWFGVLLAVVHEPLHLRRHRRGQDMGVAQEREVRD